MSGKLASCDSKVTCGPNIRDLAGFKCLRLSIVSCKSEFQGKRLGGVGWGRGEERKEGR